MAVPTATQSIDLATYLSIGASTIALLAVIVSSWTAWMQRQHNKLSFRPFPEIQLRDMSGHIKISLTNNGTGPLIIKTLSVLKYKKNTEKALIELMPAYNGWTFFAHNVDGRSIKPSGDIILLELEYNPQNPNQLNIANLIRENLRTLDIEIKYMNVYENIFPTYTKNLSWFGRLI